MYWPLETGSDGLKTSEEEEDECQWSIQTNDCQMKRAIDMGFQVPAISGLHNNPEVVYSSFGDTCSGPASGVEFTVCATTGL